MRRRWIPWSLDLLIDWNTGKLGCLPGSRKCNYWSLGPQRTHWVVLYKAEESNQASATKAWITYPMNGCPCTLFFFMVMRKKHFTLVPCDWPEYIVWKQLFPWNLPHLDISTHLFAQATIPPAVTSPSGKLEQKHGAVWRLSWEHQPHTASTEPAHGRNSVNSKKCFYS